MYVATCNGVKDAAALIPIHFLNIQMKYVLYALLRWYFLVASDLAVIRLWGYLKLKETNKCLPNRTP